eukprot:CAMPEP_0172318412 /NCGR_PEP_ID=MMETSP1058-20130122/34795_1 /TAXON_ID=83371 /ORGANISM="Detonula confervacea, Strain CCMP 353" /LENGTH=1348 /DNA_ID=CAMNT_0013033243 /DNA_START=80 /DNA_END=4123 /DNA_ORIENTATION=+
MTENKRVTRQASVKMIFTAVILLAMPMVASPHSSTTTERSMQSTPPLPPSTEFLTSNSRATIRAMEVHLFSPQVRNEMERIFQSRLEYDGKMHTFPSYKYTFAGFWRNWKRMMKDGIPTGSSNMGSGGVGGEGKFVLFAGDEVERFANITRDPRNPRQGKREIQISGYEYGLANMAAFLSQVMVDSIYDDACDERNEQEMIDSEGRPTNVFSQSNACGQYNSSYQDLVCPPSEKNMECPPMPVEKTIQASLDSGKNAFKCGPTSIYPAMRNNPNDLKRTDVEGCSWWGRGPLNTKGICSMGKVNHYLGVKALNEGRITLSTPGVFPDTDFCSNPESICTIHDEDLVWSVAMFEWAERIQQYRSSADGSTVWDYKEKLVEFVNGGMNMVDYYTDEVHTDRDNSFIHAISSIVDRGCHNAPHCFFYGEVNKLPQRRIAFTIALSALHIPTMRTELVVEQALDHLKSRKDRIESNLMLYKRDQGIFPSQRYKFDDFFDALYRFSRPYDATNTSYLTNTTYFYSDDHVPLYMGDPYMKHGHKYGLSNIALFFAIGLDLSIEKDDTCDELNEYDVSGKLPISNSCGQRGISYQDMVCSDDPDMACPVDTNMYITAVTSNRAFGAAPPLQCGPKSRIPLTGYWDVEEMYESNQAAYANVNARVEVEGCCWWSRGVLQTKGTCSFGRLNYYLGKRAADEGRQSLFPTVDFCLNPEAVCGSQYKHELIWMSGLFEWVDRVQSYDQGGFNFIEQLHVFADGGMENDEFIKRVNAIVQSGCHNPPCPSAGCLVFPCAGAYPVNENSVVTKAFRTFSQLNLWNEFPVSPGGSNAPTPSPTQSPLCQENCTEVPSSSPLTPTTLPSLAPVVILSSVPSESPTTLLDTRLTRFEDVSRYLKRRKQPIESTIFVSETNSGLAQSKLYSLDGFLNALKDLATGGVDDKMFYIGQGVAGSFDQGLVNIALFLAHAMTRGILWDTCEEVNHHLVDGKLPLSNACGQHGRSNSDDMCPMADAAKECAVDLTMSVEQTSVGNSGSPPFFCAPKLTYPFTGYYDPLSDNTMSSTPFANQAGRIDVSGCCFWGRGILLNSGVCTIGRFNHLYGLPAIMDGRSGFYNIDFCSSPEALCSSFTKPATEFNKFPSTIDTSEARYLVGMLYWIDSVQDYNWGYWNYMENVKLFVDGGMKDDSFVDEFSDIVIDSTSDGAMRKANFKKVLKILFVDVFTSSPTNKPSSKPTRRRDDTVPSGMTPPGTDPSAPATLPAETPVEEPPDGDNTPSPASPAQTGVDGAPLSTLQPGAVPVDQDPAAGPISNPQPASIPVPNRPPNRPVSIDLSAPNKPVILPSNTIGINLAHQNGLAW